MITTKRAVCFFFSSSQSVQGRLCSDGKPVKWHQKKNGKCKPAWRSVMWVLRGFVSHYYSFSDCGALSAPSPSSSLSSFLPLVTASFSV